MAHSGYVFGLKTLKFNNVVLGQISEDSIDWGGDEPTTIKIFSAQNRNTPVLELKDTPGTDELSFDLIELKPDNLIAIFGGSKATAGGYTTWTPPTDNAQKIGAVEITTDDGTIIAAGKASLTARFTGKLKYNEVFKVHCKLTFLAEGTTAPYSVKFKD